MPKSKKLISSNIDRSLIIKSKRRSRSNINYGEDQLEKQQLEKQQQLERQQKQTRVSKPRSTRSKPSTRNKPIQKTRQKKSVRFSKVLSTSKDVSYDLESESDKEEEEAYQSASSEDDDDDDASEPDSESESESELESEEEEEKPKKRAPSKYLSAVRNKVQKRSLPSVSTNKRKPTSLTNRAIHRVNQAIPVLPLRQIEQQDTSEKTSYEIARERLHVATVPDSLPCREEEFFTIMGYVESAIQEATGACVYISGVPGTGKTATVLEVIRHLQQQAEEKTIPEFDFVEINGMKLTDPNQAYSILWESMDRTPSVDGKKRRYTAAHALQLLEDKFSRPSKDQKTTQGSQHLICSVVLMDELDLLVTKKQTVMYNFFDWPSRPLSKLIVIAIANTMDLPERMMSNKIASRMGLTRITFEAYRYDQLYQIVQSRLQGIDAFAKEAVEFAARKVSAVSGDARRALDICRRAVEIIETKIAQEGTQKHVTIAIVDQAIKEMFTSPSVAFIQSCSLHQKIFLVACMHRSRAIGLAEVEFGDIAHYHIQTCKWHNIEPPNTSDLMRVCESLGQTRALIMESGRMDICMRLSLNLIEEDITMACKADKLISRLLQYLPQTDP
ncbi:Origin recognition complex subunit 1 [Choanephora cucurbitarum]|uniref:Origin recognition complex subunit 1 n=1 Tax=Choanephora cucurbitarum TaxID=101091 RepID=A0A1C7NNZ5_9FUNG|nr:Origin recognition complex subunit 1 [Choanephora cucurbitarum]